jgi:phosphatidate cytidylyltransferase
MVDRSLDPAGGAGAPGGPPGDASGRASDASRRGGRNLPAAIAVGVLLLVAVAASLTFRPEPFVALAAVAVGAALWELRQAFARRDIHIPLLPLLVGGAGMLVSAYAAGPEALLVAFVLTVAGVVVWRVLDGSGPQALRDSAAAVFAATYVPFLAGFVMLMLAQPRGELRVALFILLAVANDTGGYIAGVTLGRHPLAPGVSPKKTWEGLAGSVVLTTAVGVAGSVLVLGAGPLLGVVLGVLTAVTATVGDLAESLLKRDLELKDMGSLLPGHGGVLDRLDSMVVTAPFVFLAFTVATSAA